MKKRTFLLGAAGACLLAASATAQSSSPSTADIPQPHLAKARAAAFADQTWNFPALINCYPQENMVAQQVIKNPPPTKAFDNLYNVGIGNSLTANAKVVDPGFAVTAWAITTSDGIILIDALDSADEAEHSIIANMKKLGLDPNQIKDIIITHGHFDHYGGARWLQDHYPNAHVYMSAADYDLAEHRTSFDPPGTVAPRRDKVVQDGDKLTLGDETITMYLTPGHTPATISMIVPVKDHGVAHNLAFWGGTASAGLNADFSKKYDTSITRFIQLSKAAHVDGFISNHPSLDDTDGKLEHIREEPNAPNPFLVGLDATVRTYTVIKECNLNNADINAAKAKRKSS